MFFRGEKNTEKLRVSARLQNRCPGQTHKSHLSLRALQLLQDTQLIFLICILLVIDVVVVTLWVILDPMQRHLQNLTLEISPQDRGVVYQPQVTDMKFMSDSFRALKRSTLATVAQMSRLYHRNYVNEPQPINSCLYLPCR